MTKNLNLLLICHLLQRLAKSYSPIHRAAFILVAAWLLAAPTLAQETARPEVGKPLQAAQELLRANRFKDALAKIREADGVSGKSAYETYLIERMRGSAAAGAGDNDTAIKAFESVIATGKVPAGDQLKMIEALAGTYYRIKNYPAAIKWATRYSRDGGTSASMRTLLIQSYYQSGDVANAAKEAQTDIQADIAAGRTPSEEKLLLLANCYLKQNNANDYVATIEKLLNYYPKKSLWAEVISRIRNKSGFSDRMSLDVYRLQLATGNLTSSADYMEMAQLALQAGLPVEAKKVVDEGYKNGTLGKGADVERQKRLKDLVDKRLGEYQKAGQDEASAQASSDGNALVTLGFNLGGAKGIALMEAGIKKGDLKHPEDAKLHLGLLMLQAGQKAKAVQMLKSLQNNGGAPELARLWIIYINQTT